jgi:signal peptidase I
VVFFTRRFWTEGPGSFAVAIGLALIVRWAFLEAYVIPSTSMLPSLLVHDHIFVNKWLYGLRAPFSENWLVQWRDPERGEVVVFKHPGDKDKYYIKRVVGVPGDRILYEKGNLYVNEKLIERSIPQALKHEAKWLQDSDFPGDEEEGGRALYVHWEENLGGRLHSIILRKDNAGAPPFGPVSVPEKHYLVIGDNRDKSEDSRFWPEADRFVPRDLLIGRAAFVWLSCESTLPVLTFLCDPLKLRWSRFFHTVN